jgi:hypothetical protein
MSLGPEMKSWQHYSVTPRSTRTTFGTLGAMEEPRWPNIPTKEDLQIFAHSWYLWGDAMEFPGPASSYSAPLVLEVSRTWKVPMSDRGP